MGSATQSNVSDEELIGLVAAGDRPYATAKMVASDVDISQQAVGQRLRALADEGRLVRDKISANGVLYLLPESAN